MYECTCHRWCTAQSEAPQPPVPGRSCASTAMAVSPVAYLTVRASAFFLRREWPRTAPWSRDFMTASTLTVGTTGSLFCDILTCTHKGIHCRKLGLLVCPWRGRSPRHAIKSWHSLCRKSQRGMYDTVGRLLTGTERQFADTAPLEHCQQHKLAHQTAV